MSIIDQDVASDTYRMATVFLNGRMVGFHSSLKTVVRMLKLYKLNSIINCFTSISWNPLVNEINVFCDSGRLVRPLFALHDDLSNKTYFRFG